MNTRETVESLKALVERRATIWTLAKIVLAVVLVSIVAAQTSVEELISIGRKIVLPWAFLAVIAYWAVTFITAWRYKALLETQLPWGPAMELTVIQTVLSNFVASSAGAVSYLALLRTKHKVHIGLGLTSFILARFGDLLVLTVALAISSAAIWTRIQSLHFFVLMLLGVLGGMIISFMLVILLRQRMVKLLALLLKLCYLDRFKLTQRVLNQLQDLATQSPERLLQFAPRIIGLSLVLLLANYAFHYCVMRQFGIPLGGWEILFALAMVLLVAVVPIQVFGGLGVYEVTAVYLYGVLGVAAPLIVPFVIGFRLFLWLLNIHLLLYLPLEKFVTRNSRDTPRLEAHRSPTVEEVARRDPTAS